MFTIEDFILICSLCLVTAAIVVSGMAFWFAMRYNLHMFQQNSYKNKVQRKWIRDNYNRQRFGMLSLFVFLLVLILELVMGKRETPVNAAVSIPVEGSVLWGYRVMKQAYAKKRLVFTARVKRLAVTDVVLNLLLAGGFGTVWGKLAANPASSAEGIFIFNIPYMLYVLLLLIFLQPWILVLCNVINKPIENAVNRHYIKDAERILKRNPNLTIIGITGSYGKTSLKFFLRDLLSEKYNVIATPESFNTPMGVVRTIRENMKQTHEIFICEMGARNVGDIKEICDFVHPTHGVITSIGPQHLESFKTIENVRKTKFELADALPAEGKLFLNGDSEQIRLDRRNFNRLYYGVETKDGFYAKDITLSPLGTDFTMVTPGGIEERFHTQLIGEVNVLNLVGAIAVANSFGIELSELLVPVRRIKPVPHRLELSERGNVTIIDDAYNSNPVGSKAAVETLKLFDGARILITPGMVELGEKHKELHYKFGTYAANCCDYILLVNKNRTGDIKQGALDAGFSPERLFEFDAFLEAYGFAMKISDERHKYILFENDLPDNF